jgi:ABC-type branched-subunit amino acid transport system ATPase component
VFSTLSVGELILGAFARRAEAAAQSPPTWRNVQMFGILANDRQLAGTLSGGQQQMLAIARALMPAGF